VRDRACELTLVTHYAKLILFFPNTKRLLTYEVFDFMKFEWNPNKVELNRQKHQISFLEATTVFSDPLSVTFPDPDHSFGEERYLIIGMSRHHQILVVAHTYKAETIRIISVRGATKRERKFYEQGKL
jgi:uncharacterized protein